MPPRREGGTSTSVLGFSVFRSFWEAIEHAAHWQGRDGAAVLRGASRPTHLHGPA